MWKLSKQLNARVQSALIPAVIRSDEGLTLETSAFLIFHGGYSSFINSFDETKFLF